MGFSKQEWNSSTGMGCHALLQGIFPTQGSNLGLLHCRQILLLSEPPGTPLEPFFILKRELKTVFFKGTQSSTVLLYSSAPINDFTKWNQENLGFTKWTHGWEKAVVVVWMWQSPPLAFFLEVFFFFLMWTTFEVFIGSVTILLLFYISGFFWLQGVWFWHLQWSVSSFLIFNHSLDWSFCDVGTMI